MWCMARQVINPSRPMPGVDEIAAKAKHEQDSDAENVVVYVCTGCHHVLTADKCGTCWNDGDADIIPYTYNAEIDTVNVGDLR